MAKCSFSKVPLSGTWEPYWPFGTELHARLLYIQTDKTEVLITAFETGDTSRPATAQFRREVSEKTGIPADNIWFHELQIHAAPGADTLFGEVITNISNRVADEVNAMKTRAVPFTCEVSEAYAGTKFSYNREQYVHGLGGVTVWAGLKYDENGKPYSQDPGRMLLRGYEPDLPVFDSPIYFDNPNDPLAYLFVFKDESGKIIGTMSRFAAHPDVAVLFESHHVADYKYNYDWPGYLCEVMESEFDAPAMYINGPCANLAMKKGFEGIVTYDSSAAEAKRIGEEFAAFLLDNYRDHRAPMGDPDNCKTARYEIRLPMRDSLPHSRDEWNDETKRLAEEAAEAAMRDAIEKGMPAYEVKSRIDDRYRATYSPLFVYRTCFFTDEEFAARKGTVDFNILRLGDYQFMGIPGESLVEMTHWMRSTFKGAKTVTLDQVNGYYSYMATPTSLTLGGYTYWYSWTTRDSIPTLKDEIVKAMEDFNKD
ncbi:MAG: hypothetical protein E7553_04740 [Ruminococcaceae bacterium]|nr:hypothetical protein [Oscillospiraceae bacterium]